MRRDCTRRHRWARLENLNCASRCRPVTAIKMDKTQHYVEPLFTRTPADAVSASACDDTTSNGKRIISKSDRHALLDPLGVPQNKYRPCCQ